MTKILKPLTILIAGLLPLLACSQDPVKWTYTSKKTVPGTFEIRFTASIQLGWHVYSQSTPPGGPAPTQFTFSKNPLIEMQGKVKEEGKLEQHFEEVFGVDVKQYSQSVTFIQVVKKKVDAKTRLNVAIEYMSCNEEMCLPSETVRFSIDGL